MIIFSNCICASATILLTRQENNDLLQYQCEFVLMLGRICNQLPGIFNYCKEQNFKRPLEIVLLKSCNVKFYAQTTF
jgi:hypothetical protein